MSDAGLEARLDEAAEEVRAGIRDTLGDQPELADQEDTVAWELCASVAAYTGVPVARLRARLGF